MPVKFCGATQLNKYVI